MTLVKFNPVTNMPGFADLFDSFFGKDFNSMMERTESFSNPSVNIKETKDGFDLELAAPGMSKDQFKISLDHNVLSIAAEQKSESEKTEGKYTRREFSYGSFKRSFVLPESIHAEHIEAQYDHGILYLHLPKKDEAKVKASREISVR